MTFTFANIVTLLRLFLAPIFLLCILADDAALITAGIIIYVVAAWTDWLDGYLARRFGEVTDHGVFLDPLADKVLTTMAFIALFLLDVMPLWMVIVFVVRDFGTTALRSIADDKGTVMQTSYAAKVKTFLQMIFIAYALILHWLARTAGDGGVRFEAAALLYGSSTYIIMVGLTLLTLYTLVMYLFTNRNLFTRG
jgi:CDP-diacylglycerol--glycerol-3-phosphate 3-phosphatidyltransferase